MKKYKSNVFKAWHNQTWVYMSLNRLEFRSELPYFPSNKPWKRSILFSFRVSEIFPRWMIKLFESESEKSTELYVVFNQWEHRKDGKWPIIVLEMNHHPFFVWTMKERCAMSCPPPRMEITKINDLATYLDSVDIMLMFISVYTMISKILKIKITTDEY